MGFVKNFARLTPFQDVWAGKDWGGEGVGFDGMEKL
jgi:hypothetical protein